MSEDEPLARVSPRRWLGWPGTLVLAAVALALALDAALRLRPGPFSIDEITYHLMAKNAAAGRLFIWNGYEELASPELQSLQIRATPGGLSAQYPQGYALLAAPFYALFGYAGLFVLNASAFLGSTALCQRLGHRVLGDARWAALATALWAFASYSFEYALGIWPHSVAVAAVLASAWCLFDGVSRAEQPGSFRKLLAGGLIVGFGMTVRLDVVLCALPLLLPLLGRGALGVRRGAAFALGLVPGALLASYVNLQKWGSALPLSYGSAAHDQVVPWSLGVAACLAVLAVQQRARITRLLGARGLGLAGALTALVLLALPATRRILVDGATGVFALLIDAAALPVDPTELAIERSPSGAVVYAGVLKKALLQSCPYFTLGLAGLVVLLRDARQRSLAWLLAGTPLAYTLFYGASAWHGGLCFNMRYLLPALPFLAILSVVGLRPLGVTRRVVAVFAAGGAAAAALALQSAPRFAKLETAELVLLVAPLLLAALLGLASLLSALRPSPGASLAAAALAGLGVAHAACTSFGYDIPASRTIRGANYDSAAALAEHVENDSLFFAHFPDPMYTLVELREKVRIALPLRDGFRDFQRLASFHARSGRRIYAAFTPNVWRALEHNGKLDGFATRPLARVGWFELRELREGERSALLGSGAVTRPRYPRRLRD